MKRQVKNKKRVAEHGEVFTAQREVNAMCDMVIQETERIDSRFLELACGDGNFLIEILKRKLNIVKKKYKKSIYDYERFSLLAISSLYGVELLEDNVIECRNRLYDYWDKEYKIISKKEYDEKVCNSARFILEHNIVCGNALSLKCVDDKGNDTDEPIIFSEWTFPFNDARIQRKDYTLDELLKRDIKQQEMCEVNEDEELLNVAENEDIIYKITIDKQFEKLNSIKKGTRVYHKKFGDGNVIWIDKKRTHIKVNFKNGDKQFLFPDAFMQGHLQFV